MDAAARDLSLAAARRARIATTLRDDVRALARYPVAVADGWVSLVAMASP